MTHYEVLGVPSDATEAQIKAAYRERARKLHPDAGGQVAAFQRLQAAYECLSDPDQRAAYDLERAAGAYAERGLRQIEDLGERAAGKAAQTWVERGAATLGRRLGVEAPELSAEVAGVAGDVAREAVRVGLAALRKKLRERR